MVFMLLNPRQKKSGTSLENVAEEVLNGLFCHYEPPTSEYAQHKAAKDVRTHPGKYSFSQMKKKEKSILRTSRLFPKKKIPKAPKKKKGVTWRDEHINKGKGLEGQVEACAMDQCDFLGLSTKGGNGLADSRSPTEAKTEPGKNPFPKPIVDPKTDMPVEKEPEKDETPKKVLYDDEGNPIAEDGTDAQDENVSPNHFFCVPNVNGGQAAIKDKTPEAAIKDETPEAPRAPTGLSQLRKIARALDDNVYEPEDYDRPKPPSAQSYAYRRMRSPPVRNSTPRHGYTEAEDNITMNRSRSPASNQDQDSHMHRFNRPGTPYRRRDSGDGEQDGRRRSSSRDRGRDSHNREEAAQYDTDYRHIREHYEPQSPARRSDVYSDLTMDEAIAGRRRFPQSPAKTSEGVEVDVHKGRPRPRSRSPGRYRLDSHEGQPDCPSPADYGMDRRPSREHSKQYAADDQPSGLESGVDRRHSRGYGDHSAEMGQVISQIHAESERRRSHGRDNESDRKNELEQFNKNNDVQSERLQSTRRESKSHENSDQKSKKIEGDDREAPRLPKRGSKEADDRIDDKNRRRSSGQSIKKGDGREQSKSSRSKRVSAPLPSKSLSHKDNSDRGTAAVDDKNRNRKSKSQRTPEYDTDLNNSRNRDPTPRRDREPSDEDEGYASEGPDPLPPTPRKKDVDRQSSRDMREDRFEEDVARSRPARTGGREDGGREDGITEEEQRSWFSRSSRKDHPQERKASEEGISRPQPVDSSRTVEPSIYEQAYNAFIAPFSPTSVATDDEIRAEVSSVGMESSTLRPINYYNPFTHVPPPIMEEAETNEEQESKQDISVPSTLSKSTVLSEQKPSSKGSTNRHRDKRKKTKEPKQQPAHEIKQASSNGSGSTRSKKLWRGWKKAVGKVKAIVQDIDEKRIPPPVLQTDKYPLDPRHPTKHSSKHHSKMVPSRE